MNKLFCPLCQKEMVPGRVGVHKHLATKLSWPFHSDRLVFKADGGGEKPELVIREGASYTAYKCEGCAVYLVTKERYG